MRVPSKAIEQHADENKHRPATRRFTPSVYRKSPGYYVKFTINFHEINEEIGKTRGGKFARATLNYVRDEILSLPSVQVVKRHAPYVFEIKIIPFSDLQKIDENKENLTRDVVVAEEPIADSKANTENLSEDTGIEQQQLINADKLCKSVGVIFQRRDLPAIAKYPIDLIKRAVDHYRCARNATSIHTPTGWLLRNLQHKWYLSHNAVSTAMSLVDKYFELQDTIVDAVGAIPTRTNQLSLFPKKMGSPHKN